MKLTLVCAFLGSAKMDMLSTLDDLPQAPGGNTKDAAWG